MLSVPYIKEYCDKENLNLDQQIIILMTHGYCHLLGYEHDSTNDFNAMRRIELKYLRKLVLDGIQIDNIPESRWKSF